MSYTRTSPIIGHGVASAEAIQAWFGANAARGASWVGLPPVAIPSGLGAAIVTAAGQYEINSDLGTAQIAHETAFGQSRIFRDKRNPAGIGAENDDPYKKALTYETVEEGVDAWAAHLAGYVLGDGPWNALSPRYAIVKANGWAGTVRVLADLEQKWAWTKPAVYDVTPLAERYGAKIAALANDLADFAEHGTWDRSEEPMAGDDSRFAWQPDTTEFGYPQGTRGRSGKPIDYLIIHVTEGTDSLAWLTAGNGSSAHYLTRRDATPRAQMVAEADAAWTAGSRDYNERGINIEFERFARDAWTDDEYCNAAATCLPIIRRHNIPLVYLGRDSAGKRGIIGHQDVPDGQGGWGGSTHHRDPGPRFSFDRFIAEMAALAGDEQPQPDYREFPETGHGISGGFLWFWEHNGGLPIFGYPLTDELEEDGMTVQYFERAVFEYHPENSPEWSVLLRRLGAEALASKGEAA